MYIKGLFHPWVPQKIQLILLALFTTILMFTSSIYSGNINDMVSSLGSMTELITMANNASTIGMMVVFPLLMRTKQYFRSKQLLISSLLMLAFFSIVCGTTDSAYLLVFCSFLMGLFKMFAMIEIILPVMVILSPTGNRGIFYSMFYPFSITLGQLSGYYTAVLAAKLQWQYSYIFIAIILLGACLLAVIFMHNQRSGKQVPLHYFDWLSLVLLSISLMCLNYVLVFSRQLEWFQSSNIQLSTAAFGVTLAWFIQRQLTLKRPYLSLTVFKKKNVINSLLLIFLMGMYMAAGSIQSAFSTNVLRYDAQTNASLNLLMVPGIVMAGLVSYIWFKRKYLLKVFILMGFGAYQLYAVYMYFLIAPVIDIEYFIFPTVLRGFAMCILFIGIGFYAADKLQMSEMLSSSSVLVAFRSFIGTGVFGALISWLLYQLQWQHLAHMGADIDIALMETSSPSITQFGNLQTQAILATSKEIFGYIILAGWAVLLYVALHRFLPIHYRRLILLKKIRKRESIKGYNLSGEVAASAL